jgi:hypothetical protein
MLSTEFAGEGVRRWILPSSFAAYFDGAFCGNGEKGLPPQNKL